MSRQLTQMCFCSPICFPVWHRANAEGICHRTSADVAERQLDENNSTPVVIIWKLYALTHRPYSQSLKSAWKTLSIGVALSPCYLTIDYSPIKWVMKFGFKVRARELEFRSLTLRTDHQNVGASEFSPLWCSVYNPILIDSPPYSIVG